MKKFWVQILIILMVIIASLYYTFGGAAISLPFNIGTIGQNNPGSTLPANTILKINQAIIKIEVADTQAKRSLGLGNRTSLSADSGMLFVFTTPQKYQFWMKNMKIPLDMIFIREGMIVDLIKNIPPPTPDQTDETLPLYQPTVPIDMLLEVNAGFSDIWRIKVGDIITLVD